MEARWGVGREIFVAGSHGEEFECAKVGRDAEGELTGRTEEEMGDGGVTNVCPSDVDLLRPEISGRILYGVCLNFLPQDSLLRNQLSNQVRVVRGGVFF